MEVAVEIPVELNFGGAASFYYDDSNETRKFFGQYTNAPSGEELYFGGTINPGEIPNPTRWYLVLEGQAGPGAQEPQAIVAKTGLADWQFDCVH